MKLRIIRPRVPDPGLAVVVAIYVVCVALALFAMAQMARAL